MTGDEKKLELEDNPVKAEHAKRTQNCETIDEFNQIFYESLYQDIKEYKEFLTPEDSKEDLISFLNSTLDDMSEGASKINDKDLQEKVKEIKEAIPQLVESYSKQIDIEEKKQQEVQNIEPLDYGRIGCDNPLETNELNTKIAAIKTPEEFLSLFIEQSAKTIARDKTSFFAPSDDELIPVHTESFKNHLLTVMNNGASELNDNNKKVITNALSQNMEKYVEALNEDIQKNLVQNDEQKTLEKSEFITIANTLKESNLKGKDTRWKKAADFFAEKGCAKISNFCNSMHKRSVNKSLKKATKKIVTKLELAGAISDRTLSTNTATPTAKQDKAKDIS